MRKMVGVNAYTEGDDGDTEILRIDPAFEVDQVRRCREIRERRDADARDAALDARSSRRRAIPAQNLMPLLLEAPRARRDRGRDRRALQTVFGTLPRSAGVLTRVRPSDAAS